MTKSDQSSEQTSADVPGHTPASVDPHLIEDDVQGHCRWRTVDLQAGEDDVEGPLLSR